MIIAPDNIITKIRQATGGLSSSDSSDIRNLGVIFDRSMCLNSHGKYVVHVFSILGTVTVHTRGRNRNTQTRI